MSLKGKKLGQNKNTIFLRGEKLYFFVVRKIGFRSGYAFRGHGLTRTSQASVLLRLLVEKIIAPAVTRRKTNFAVSANSAQLKITYVLASFD
ncbi:hypothetical protein NYE67_04360 [Solibacillus sp. FSL W8-0474]|uniref:hypothetical protein n=1 Tax=Solibacillus sp. FSL W8-0474 TaxID=2975336 RepID=UPI0030F85D80